jgi:hypothetical protein
MPWRPIGVIPVRYEHHLHIKSKAVPDRIVRHCGSHMV